MWIVFIFDFMLCYYYFLRYFSLLINTFFDFIHNYLNITLICSISCNSIGSDLRSDFIFRQE